ncbi:hypothetical protein [Burkholderia multivorans]|uniref:hypothetical protein n=1 Tax=Burkholderia multivorans TaxID=87883 RepID=UPI0021575018|nr:hypothetical protein [Burkholderia multivorans]MDN7476626.1 hypothetical protein [Burkholderia multivorans]
MTANGIATALTGGQGVSHQVQLAAIVTGTSLLGGAAAGLLGQNALAAMTAARNETLNNTCAPGHNCGTLTSAIKDTGRAAWKTAVGTVEAIPSFVNGALPGYPDYVPFLSDATLPYDDPDFGSLVSLVGRSGRLRLLVAVGRLRAVTLLFLLLPIHENSRTTYLPQALITVRMPFLNHWDTPAPTLFH